MGNDVRELLQQVKDGGMSVDDAAAALKAALKAKPFEDLGFAKVDLHRKVRQGASEVIYGEGKTAEQIAGIVAAMRDAGQPDVLITRLSADKARVVAESAELRYSEVARAGIVGKVPEPDGCGKVLVVTGGTSDMPVAEEAALTAEMLGNEVSRVYDVGVAGLHRTLSHVDDIMSANVIVAVAGMEGALASIVGGLAECPVIAVPTSVGYGASFGGVAALLSMLNSCASGVSVVNIDNGFGAGFLASRINHMGKAGR